MILDLFAGPGGWSEGLRALGASDIGIEIDGNACRTRAAAGHATIRGDVQRIPLRVGEVDGLIASPPCTDFSIAGKKVGRFGDTGRLIDTVPEFVKDWYPRWVVCEQVPPCIDIWREHAAYYRELGYRIWCGVLNAANFGVPQTRRRAFLLAALNFQPHPPAPTHARKAHATLFEQRERWVSMAEALGWGMTDRPAVALVSTSGEGGPRPLDGGAGARAIVRGERDAGRWVLDRRFDYVDGAPTGRTQTMDEPAPTFVGEAGAKGVWTFRRNDQTNTDEIDRDWPLSRPATTIASRDLVPDPGTNANRFNGAEKSRNDGIHITVEQALVLQSFRPDYPVIGTKTSQFQQIGNAVPPLVAERLLAQFVT